MKKQILFASLVGMVAGVVLISSPAYAVRVLVTLGSRVQEIDASTNRIVSEYVDPEGQDLYNADRLPNGHTLIAKHSKVFEIDAGGNIVWQKDGHNLGYQTVVFYDAKRLGNGDTLVTGSAYTTSSGPYNPMGAVLQLNPAGQVVWRYESTPESNFAPIFTGANRLSNGNTLISADGYYGFALEVNPSGNVVWLYYPLVNNEYYTDAVYDTHRLPNGNTLIAATTNGPVGVVQEVTPQGQVIPHLWPMEIPEEVEKVSQFFTYYLDRYSNSPGGRIFVVNAGSSGSQIVWNYGLSYSPRDLDVIPPMNLSAGGGIRQIVLDWDDYPTSGQFSYEIYRATTSGGPYTYIGFSGTESRFVDTNVTVGLRYYYVVNITDAGLVSSFSNEASATATTGPRLRALDVTF